VNAASGIVLEHLGKTFGGGPVLQGFSASVAPGEAVALMGASGGGKTTLARIIMGLEKPDTGRVLGTEHLRFACVFQEDRLCEGFTAVANVALVLPRHSPVDVPAALRQTGLSAEELAKPAGKLSGGEKRRVALVRAMEAPSDVVVLDEAFKGLDAASRLQAYAYVKSRLAGRTLLLITHDPAEAEAFGARVVPVQKAGGAEAGPPPADD